MKRYKFLKESRYLVELIVKIPLLTGLKEKGSKEKGSPIQGEVK